jgi:hypothetical protein
MSIQMQQQKNFLEYFENSFDISRFSAVEENILLFGSMCLSNSCCLLFCFIYLLIWMFKTNLMKCNQIKYLFYVRKHNQVKFKLVKHCLKNIFLYFLFQMTKNWMIVCSFCRKQFMPNFFCSRLQCCFLECTRKYFRFNFFVECNTSDRRGLKLKFS